MQRAALCRIPRQRDGVGVRVFFMGDDVGCATTGRKLPDGYYRLDRMIASAAGRSAVFGCCGTCMDARGIGDDRLVTAARRSTLDELTDWTLWADTVVTF